MKGSWPRTLGWFLVTNAAVLTLAGLVSRALGLDALLWQAGVSPVAALAFAAVFGFGGSLVSLVMSKRMALWGTGAHIIDQPRDRLERWLVETVHRQARAAGIDPPDVAIYDAPDPNAFATGARRNSALVAVSTGLLEAMDQREVEAVLAHEVAHVANGDMVTMALLQGVLNTFVIFISRLVGYVVDRVLLRNERGVGLGFYAASFAAELCLGLLATIVAMWFSRQREYRADAGAAQLEGASAMIEALEALGRPREASTLPPGLAAFGILPAGLLGGLLRSHPTIEQRIARLRRAALDRS